MDGTNFCIICRSAPPSGYWTLVGSMVDLTFVAYAD